VKKLLGRTRHRWEDNIEIDLKKIEWEVWTGLSGSVCGLMVDS
jgi:hypothetical protein